MTLLIRNLLKENKDLRNMVKSMAAFVGEGESPESFPRARLTNTQASDRVYPDWGCLPLSSMPSSIVRTRTRLMMLSSHSKRLARWSVPIPESPLARSVAARRLPRRSASGNPWILHLRTIPPTVPRPLPHPTPHMGPVPARTTTITSGPKSNLRRHRPISTHTSSRIWMPLLPRRGLPVVQATWKPPLSLPTSPPHLGCSACGLYRMRSATGTNIRALYGLTKLRQACHRSTGNIRLATLAALA